MVWLSTTTCTPRWPRRRLRPPLLRSMRFSLRWLPSMAKHENLERILHLRAKKYMQPVRVLSSMVPCARYQSGCSTYIVVDRLNLPTSHNPAIQDYIGCRLPWMVHHAMRRGTSIACLGEQATPTDLPAGGY